MPVALPPADARPAHLLLHAATGRSAGFDAADGAWPSPSALAQAAAQSTDPRVAAVWQALHDNADLLGAWPWPDALELTTRVLAQWPALADRAVGPGVVRGWLEAELRVQAWVAADAWQAASVDPELRDLLWGVQRAFVRRVAAESALTVSAAYRALGLRVGELTASHGQVQLVVGTDERAMTQRSGEAPRTLPAPQSAESAVPLDEPQPLERLAFEAGIKPVLRLDHLPFAELPAQVARWRARGLFALPGWQRYALRPGAKALRLDGTGLALTCLFVGRDEAEVAAAADADATEKSPVLRSLRDAATRELGRLLGYPPCCTEAFLALHDQGANEDWCVRVARSSSDGPHPWFVNTWRDIAEILPFYPCRWDCTEARTYGRRLAAALSARQPTTAQKMHGELHGVVLAWPGNSGLEPGNVLLQACEIERGEAGLRRVTFHKTLHWSQLAGVDSGGGLPDWLFAARQGGQLQRDGDGWLLQTALGTTTFLDAIVVDFSAQQ